MARACRSQSRTSYQGNAGNYSTRHNNKPSNYFEVSTDEEGEDVKLPIYHMGGPNTTPIVVVAQFNGKRLKMEVDTGAAISVVSKCTYTYDRLFSNLEIVKPSVRLKTYTGKAMKLIQCRRNYSRSKI